MKPLFLVMAGGAIGAALRYLVAQAVPRAASGWPWATFGVNVAGGLAMGLLAGWLLRAPHDALRLFAGVGLLGGFTTFSAFGLENVAMIDRGAWGQAAAYTGLSVIAAIGATALGLAWARA